MDVKIVFKNGGSVHVYGEGVINVDFNLLQDEIESFTTEGMITTHTEWKLENGAQELGKKVGEKK